MVLSGTASEDAAKIVVRAAKAGVAQHWQPVLEILDAACGEVARAARGRAGQVNSRNDTKVRKSCGSGPFIGDPNRVGDIHDSRRGSIVARYQTCPN